jgi:succinate---hydroxymethylglutarate CoA-transferase
LNRDFIPERVPRSGHPTLAPCQLFPTSDGWIYIMANKEKFFATLCEKLGQPELANDPRFTNFTNRLAHRAELSAALDPLFRRRGTSDWLEAFAGSIPAAPVIPMEQAIRAPYIKERGAIVDVTSDSGAVIKLIGSPFKTGDEMPHRSAPPLGRDTDELLVEAGYSRESIDALRQAGTVA